MRWLAIVFAATACDRVLGLHDTQLADGPTPDAAPVCPMSGTVPTFSHIFHQVTTIPCSHFVPSFASGTAIAECAFTTNPSGTPAYGPIGQDPTDPDLATMSSLSVPLPGFPAESVVEVTPSADGTELWAHTVGGTPNVALEIYDLANGVATFKRLVTLPAVLQPENNQFLVGAPSRDRHFLYTDLRASPVVLYELVESGGVATDITGNAFVNFDFTNLEIYNPVHLSEDGLRVIIQQIDPPRTVFYSVRPDLATPFSTPVPLSIPTEIGIAVLRSDCGRIYFDAIGFVFYLAEA